MRILDPIRNNPVAALCVVAAGVAGWLGSSLLRPDPQPVARYADTLAPPPASSVSVSVAFDELATEEQHQRIAPDVLPRLRPGMTRVEIEGLLGPPAPTSLQPVAVDGRRTTYQTAYELAEPDPPHTVRPLPRPPVRRDPADPKAVVALEYDASKPGHPLVGVVYLDPLF